MKIISYQDKIFQFLRNSWKGNRVLEFVYFLSIPTITSKNLFFLPSTSSSNAWHNALHTKISIFEFMKSKVLTC